MSQVWWCMSIIPALRRQRQEDHEFRVSLSYMVSSMPVSCRLRPCLKTSNCHSIPIHPYSPGRHHLFYSFTVPEMKEEFLTRMDPGQGFTHIWLRVIVFRGFELILFRWDFWIWDDFAMIQDFFFLLFICAYNVWVISPPNSRLFEMLGEGGGIL
jgi:hypothetical protein